MDISLSPAFGSKLCKTVCICLSVLLFVFRVSGIHQWLLPELHGFLSDCGESSDGCYTPKESKYMKGSVKDGVHFGILFVSALTDVCMLQLSASR